jgi:hypothetical protein
MVALFFLFLRWKSNLVVRNIMAFLFGLCVIIREDGARAIDEISSSLIPVKVE